MNKIIEDEDEKRLQKRISQSEPRTEVRRQLNFQEDDHDYEEMDRKQKIRYQRRMELMMQVDEEAKRAKDEKEKRKRQDEN